jgi:heptosyltransferase-2
MVRVPNWLGDAVMALPALRELRRMFADARITLVARPSVAGLFDSEGLADEIIAVGDHRTAIEAVRNFVRDVWLIRRARFDLAVLLQNAFGASLLAHAGGAKEVAGYATDGRRALLDLVVPFEQNYKLAHQVRYYLNITAEIERKLTGETRIDAETAAPRLHATENQRARARSILEEAGISADEMILAINPGATNSRAKRWPAERFAATADRLAERNGFKTIIVGTPGDVEAANQVAAQMRSSAAVLAGRTDVAQLKGVLACSSLMVSNDTGAAHVSAALGVPTVVIFGPTQHFSTRPLSDLARVVRHDVECSPCMLRDCPIDHRCMTRVEMDDVYLAAQDLLVSAVG